MKIILKSLLLPVLFVLFFVSSIFNNNITEVSFVGFVYSISIISIIVIIFFFLCRIFIKNYTRISLSVSFLVIFFFSYFPLYRLVQGIEINDFLIGRHIILFPLILSGVIFCLYMFLKSKKNFNNLLKISLGVSLVLVMGNIVEISMSYTAFDFEKLIIDNSSNELSSSDKKYNVYHLILDEYPSSKSLQKYRNFDNSDFENFLKDKGFHIVENSFSNYRQTLESIPSILNMDYHNSLEGLEDKSRKLALKYWSEENSVVKNFENLGYKTIYLGNEYYIGKPSTSDEYCNFFLGEFLMFEFIISNTPIALLKMTIDPNSINRYVEHRLCIFSELKSLDDKYVSPIFVHAHVIMPHSPYLFDKDGNVLRNVDLSNVKDPNLMLGQLQFVNTLTIDFVNSILSKDSSKSIIIIQSDHGTNTMFTGDEFSEKEQIEYQYSNFIAYYFPDQNIELPELITPVNTFRILFNTYFNGEYEILENRMFSLNGTNYVEHTETLLELIE